jgi:hypothetical protein
MRKLHHVLYQLPTKIKIAPIYFLLYYFLFSVFPGDQSTGQKIAVVIISVLCILIVNGMFYPPKSK